MYHKKQIFKLSILQKLLGDENGCVSLVSSTRLLALPPFFLNDMKAGILYLLNSMLKKYDRSLDAIVIGYQNVKILLDENTGIISMGTSETEVNISVEFFIFQPKIGNFLEGIVNKKSNNHIGCLVHQYFNATILKPEDVNYDNWICKDFNVNDKIIFKVKDLDFTSMLPYIEGVVEDDNLLNKDSFIKDDTSNVNNIAGDINATVPTVDIIKNIQDNELFIKNDKEKSLNKSEMSSDSGNVELTTSKGGHKKKKKKEKKNKKEKGVNANESSSAVNDDAKEENETNLYMSTARECMTSVKENPGLSDTPVLSKKKKKKRKKDNDSFASGTETYECASPREEENVLCSTQLEPNSDSKMMIPFCSPIDFKKFSKVEELEKSESQISDFSLGQDNSQDKFGKKAKRQKKRKREESEQLECFSSPKRIKSSHAFFTEDEDEFSQTHKEKSEIEKVQPVDGLVNFLDATTNEGVKGKKIAEHKVEELPTDLLKNKTIESEKRYEEYCMLNELGMDDTRTSETIKSKKSVNKKEELMKKTVKAEKKHKAKVNEVKKCESWANFRTESLTEAKKSKTVEHEKKISSSSDALLDKLLNEARSFIEMGEYNPKEAEKTAKKNDGELFRLSKSPLKKKDSKKKSKYSQKINDCHQSPSKSKNGSMGKIYDTPEKKFSDSLFSESEQSDTSPAKKRTEVNGFETPSKEPRVQNKLLKFGYEEVTRLKDESNNDKPKDSVKKDKSKKKSHTHSEEKDSLYEKLLKEEKRLIEIKGDSPPKKKMKSAKKEKKGTELSNF